MKDKVLFILFALCVMAGCFVLMVLTGCSTAIGVEEGFEHQVYHLQHLHDLPPTPIEVRP